jgi:hypothetical protein
MYCAIVLRSTCRPPIVCRWMQHELSVARCTARARENCNEMERITKTHGWPSSMTSGAIQQGVPANVVRDRYAVMSPAFVARCARKIYSVTRRLCSSHAAELT